MVDILFIMQTETFFFKSSKNSVLKYSVFNTHIPPASCPVLKIDNHSNHGCGTKEEGIWGGPKGVLSSHLLSKAEVASSNTIVVGFIKRARANPTYDDGDAKEDKKRESAQKGVFFFAKPPF